MYGRILAVNRFMVNAQAIEYYTIKIRQAVFIESKTLQKTAPGCKAAIII
jgi:hypothetical protein